MTERPTLNERKRIEEELRSFTRETEPISLAAYYEWGKPTGFQQDEPDRFLFDKVVRELLSQSALVFSENGGVVIPAPSLTGSYSNIFRGLKLLGKNNTSVGLMEGVQEATEIAHLDANMKRHLCPAGMSSDEWNKRLNKNTNGFTRNVGFRLRLGIVLTEERRQKLVDSGKLRSNYRSLISKNHPDINKNDRFATDESQRINKAYEILNSRQKFSMYTRGK